MYMYVTVTRSIQCVSVIYMYTVSCIKKVGAGLYTARHIHEFSIVSERLAKHTIKRMTLL